MDSDSVFWKIADGRLPPPPCAKTLGIEFLRVVPDCGSIEVKFEATPAFLNLAGHVQGGFLAAMLDDTMGPALVATLDADEFAPTVSLNVQFHRPARVGPLKGVGRVLLRGREVCQLSGELLQNDRVVATGTATAVIRRIGTDKAWAAAGKPA
ncbi:MAG: PaaI family thioesterase [Rhodopseudomonas palustris]|uniref:PaaI family thioesterase n=1 Tax=Rhodopseudomonas palustris TaxID=1076 RepID=A0A933S061_RHOPL|nr:PaaI family thioesterase [Rhodopseudomonas palustris]